MRTKKGCEAQPSTPPITAGIADARAHPTMPAPKVEADHSMRLSQARCGAASPVPSPSAAPPPRCCTERRSKVVSVSARRMLATASPEGKASRRRSTSTGVYSMPTPTPSMPMHAK